MVRPGTLKDLAFAMRALEPLGLPLLAAALAGRPLDPVWRRALKDRYSDEELMDGFPELIRQQKKERRG